MTREVRHPFPSALGTDTNFELTRAGIVDENARYIVRRMIADAYAIGWQDGHIRGTDDAHSDRRAKQDAEDASSVKN